MRDEVDLAKLINRPDKAREFIDGIDWRPDERPETVNLGGDDIIQLNDMTDNDAVRVAQFLLKNLEIPKLIQNMHLYLPLH
jgi:hypothetical protein